MGSLGAGSRAASCSWSSAWSSWSCCSRSCSWVLTAFKSEDQYISGNGFSLDSWAELFNVLPVVQELIKLDGRDRRSRGADHRREHDRWFRLREARVPRLGGWSSSPSSPGLMIPMQSIIIPEFVNIARVAHLNNQYLGAVLVYAALGAPFATYLMTTYYRGIPTSSSRPR